MAFCGSLFHGGFILNLSLWRLTQISHKRHKFCQNTCFEVVETQLAAAATEVTAAETEQPSLESAAVVGKNDGLPGNFVRATSNLQPATLTQNKAGTAQPDDKSDLLEADKKDEQSSKSSLKQEREKLQVQVDSLKERLSQGMEERTRISSKREKQTSRKTTAVARVAESRAGLEKHRFRSTLPIFKAFKRFCSTLPINILILCSALKEDLGTAT